MIKIHCKECGRLIDTSRYNGMCQSCYVYFRNGGKVNPIPEPGRIEYDYRGYVVCHICGKAYKRLGSHVKEFHNISIEEYKKQFGLCARAKTTEKSYSDMMSLSAKKNNMDKQLIEAGKNTRIKKGDVSKRANKEVRLQERLDKRDRMLNKQ